MSHSHAGRQRPERQHGWTPDGTGERLGEVELRLVVLELESQ
jgi:hypothetical protein